MEKPTHDGRLALSERRTPGDAGLIVRVTAETPKSPALAGFNYNEERGLTCEQARKLLGKNCTLSDQQLEALIDEFVALASVVNDAFMEQRKQRNPAASQQPIMSEFAA